MAADTSSARITYAAIVLGSIVSCSRSIVSSPPRRYSPLLTRLHCSFPAFQTYVARTRWRPKQNGMAIHGHSRLAYIPFAGSFAGGNDFTVGCLLGSIVDLQAHDSPQFLWISGRARRHRSPTIRTNGQNVVFRMSSPLSDVRQMP